MRTMNLRIGVAEVVAVGSLLLLTGLAVLFALQWPVGLIPAVTFAMANGAAYAGYRLYERERAREARSKVVQFRVIDRRGVSRRARYGNIWTRLAAPKRVVLPGLRAHARVPAGEGRGLAPTPTGGHTQVHAKLRAPERSFRGPVSAS